MLKKTLPESEHKKLESFVAIQIQLTVAKVNVSNNIRPDQIASIARELIQIYPVESLEDFVMCFRRGALGFYGPIYRLDAAVLCDWMAKHLDEKYQLIEAKISQQQTETNDDNAINYEAYKARVAEFTKREKPNNFKENEYQRQRLEKPYKYYTVRGLQIYATSQAHAETIVEDMIKRGEVEEVPNETTE